MQSYKNIYKNIQLCKKNNFIKKQTNHKTIYNYKLKFNIKNR